jgi:hypothetical protein
MKNMDVVAHHHSDLILILSVAGGQSALSHAKSGPPADRIPTFLRCAN